MRIIQIIDSLEAGGAERMAVNYANALAEKVEFSGIITTRKEGILKNQIHSEVSYLFLNKKKSIDFKAVFRLRKYIVKNQINLIHAHSSSFFIAVLVKLTFPKIKIIWHDHYGISQDLTSRKNLGLKLGSLFFTGSIAVNAALKEWAESYLFCSNVIFFPNFIDVSLKSDSKTILKGKDGKRIICVANLRPQKNHKLLIDVANTLRNKFPDWTFHLLGKDFDDNYSKEIKTLVTNLNLENTIFFYGTINNVASALEQSDIAVLTSLSEGLPLSVLEYGLYKLPVVATRVGEISKIITSEKDGLIVESANIDEFVSAMEQLILSESLRKELALKLYENIQLNFSKNQVIKEYSIWLDSLINFAPSQYS